MLSISVNFSYPYLLLLIPVAILATLIPYFMMNKRYRKTRNRIVSMICHIVATTLAILLLAGTEFVNTHANTKNEILLLVDVSDTSVTVEKERDDLIETIIDQAQYDKFNVGIVTFGFDQVYAVPFTRNYDSIMDKYLSADLPDCSATNIAQALLYSKTLFSNQKSGKIVLISDGKETDETAKNVIRNVVASGIKLDVARLKPEVDQKNDLEVAGITLPDYHISVNEQFNISVDLVGQYDGNATLSIYDNGVMIDSIAVSIAAGTTTVSIPYSFKNDGLHSVSVDVSVPDDIQGNNEYTTYLYLEQYNKILILEQEDGSSEVLKNLLEEDNLFNVDVINVLVDELPKTVDELCQYDEVITNNIANSDLTPDFVNILNKYVNECGGGLFTVGGVDSSDEAHAYNRQDMAGTLFQQMLPVQAINYKPPVGVIVIIDRSGSMGGADEYGASFLDYARQGATSCLGALSERDYFGLMTLDSKDYEILAPTPRTQETKILSAINSITEATGGTVFTGAIDSAGRRLRALKNVDKKHIIVVSDGQMVKTEMDIYEEYAKEFAKDGITISTVGVNIQRPSNYKYLEKEETPYDQIEQKPGYNAMLRLAKMTEGRFYVIDNDNRSQLVVNMREDLKSPDILEVNYKDFNPIVNDVTNSIFSGIEINSYEEDVDSSGSKKLLPFTLGGYNGTKVRTDAQLLIVGEFNIPIYAQWKYGNGTVGSFTSDLNNIWSSNLLADDDGKTLVKNIVRTITPITNIRSNDIKLSLIEDNYINTLSVFTDLNEGEYIKAEVNYGGTTVSLSELNSNNLNAYALVALNKDNNYSRAKFVLKECTTYQITATKYDKNGNVIGSNSIFKSLPFSKEYSKEYVDSEIEKQMQLYANYGNGKYIEDLSDPHEIIDSFDINYQTKIDPRTAFCILIIILFLIDFAVRKFKFKWPHEIIRDRKKK